MNKFKKTAMRKQQTNNQTENAQAAEKDIMEGEQCFLCGSGYCGAPLVLFSFHSSLKSIKYLDSND